MNWNVGMKLEKAKCVQQIAAFVLSRAMNNWTQYSKHGPDAGTVVSSIMAFFGTVWSYKWYLIKDN